MFNCESILGSLLNQPEMDSRKAGRLHDRIFIDERIVDKEFKGMCLGRNIADSGENDHLFRMMPITQTG